MKLFRQEDTSSFSRQSAKAVAAINKLHELVPLELQNIVHHVGANERLVVEDKSIVLFAENYFAICVTSLADEDVAKRQNLPQELRYAVVFINSKIFVFNEAGKLILQANDYHSEKTMFAMNMQTLHEVYDVFGRTVNNMLRNLNQAAGTYNIEFDPAGDLINRLKDEFKLEGLIAHPRFISNNPEDEMYHTLICDSANSVSIVAAKTDKNGKIISAKLEFDREGNFRGVKALGLTAEEEMGVIEYTWSPMVTVQKCLKVFAQPIKDNLTRLGDNRLLAAIGELEAGKLNRKAATATTR